MTPRMLMVVQLAVAAAGIAIIAATWKSSASVIGIALVIASLAIGGVRQIQLGNRAAAAVFFVVCAVLVVLAATRLA
jgi:hypothetical protein